MNAELDALIIRSLPELDDAATSLETLTAAIAKEIDQEVQTWLTNNDWKGDATWQEENGTIWLAPKDWLIPSDLNDTYLYFELSEAESTSPNFWQLSNFVGVGQQRYGFKLFHCRQISKTSFTKFWRLQNTSGLPLQGSDLFVPIVLDGETLANAVQRGSISDALQPLRGALDQLPKIVSQLNPLKQQIVTAIVERAKG